MQFDFDIRSHLFLIYAFLAYFVFFHLNSRILHAYTNTISLYKNSWGRHWILRDRESIYNFDVSLVQNLCWEIDFRNRWRLIRRTIYWWRRHFIYFARILSWSSKNRLRYREFMRRNVFLSNHRYSSRWNHKHNSSDLIIRSPNLLFITKFYMIKIQITRRYVTIPILILT